MITICVWNRILHFSPTV